MEWLIALTGIALLAYWFGVPSRHTRRIADHMAAGAARGARRATHRYFRRRDLYWLGGLLLAGLIFLIVIFDDDEPPASATETAEAAPTTETISSPSSFGDTGPDVVIVQERLAAEGLPVTADGAYGQETVDAVIAFQEQEQLTVDGVVGSETGEALGIWSS
jgi:hypothetical protein